MHKSVAAPDAPLHLRKLLKGEAANPSDLTLPVVSHPQVQRIIVPNSAWDFFLFHVCHFDVLEIINDNSCSIRGNSCLFLTYNTHIIAHVIFHIIIIRAIRLIRCLEWPIAHT